MKTYLNLGCGRRFHDSWTNADLYATRPGVVTLNALDRLPFADGAFEAVYTSHVLEHIPRDRTLPLLRECARVLRQDGIIRIVVPDLEQIARHYLDCLDQALADPGDARARDDYDWAMLELYDQCVRTRTGGDMASYLAKRSLANEAAVYARGGNEIRMLRERLLKNTEAVPPPRLSLYVLLRRAVGALVSRSARGQRVLKAFELGAFRVSGEVHQWMYDRYSLGRLLQEAGFRNIAPRSVTASGIPLWERYNLDLEQDGTEWKPHSLYMEASK